MTIYSSLDESIESMEIKKNKEIEEDKKYKLVIDQNILHALEVTNSKYVKNFTLCCDNIQDVFIENWKEVGSLPTPNDYFEKVEGGKDND